MDPLTKFIILLLAILGLAHSTFGFSSLIRSVEYCAIVEPSQIESCHEICNDKFHHLNKYAETSDKIIGEKRLPDGSDNTCCCKYDDFWPIKNEDDWKPNELVEKLEGKFHHCSIIASHLMNKETTELHKNVCKYLSKPQPLTVYELKDFMETTSKLRSLHSKNPIMSSLLKQKYIAQITSDSVEKFSSLFKPLIDRRRRWNKAEDANIEVAKIESVRQTVSNIRQHIDSPVVDRSLDELLVSYVIMNVLNANQIIAETNQLLSKNYYKYKPQDIAENIDQSDKENLDCGKFIAVHGVLKDLVEEIKSALNSTVIVESVYETMTDPGNGWRQMKRLHDSIGMYQGVIGAVC